MKLTPLIAALLCALLTGCAHSPAWMGTTSPAAQTAAAQSSAPDVPAEQMPNAQPRSVAVFPTGALQPLSASDAASAGVAQLQPPADLWERIRRGFAMPTLDNELVQQHQQWYASRPDYLLRMTQRSRKYLFHVVEELERRNMPSELALLPFIESAFNPQAVSSARAAGMWQFMPATGKHFELKQNFFRDDRRDVLASTRAALDYLQRLYGMFGDWQLALAAYNWGEGSVGRAIARNKKSGLPTTYSALSMPAETRNYVPKLQAVKNIIANPQDSSAELPLIGNHPYFDTVDISRDIDVELAARLADVRLEDFKALNPSQNRPVILAAGTPQILLPWDNAAVFRRNLQAHTEGGYATWTAWTVPSTMSVADAARRVGMNESELRSINSIPPRMRIRAGSVLMVPRSGKVQQDVTSHVADNGQLSLTPEVVTRRAVVKAGKRDTVASMAKRYKLAAAQVAEWNKVSTSTAFRAGQPVVLYLPVKASAKSARAGARKPAQARGSRSGVQRAAPAKRGSKRHR